MAPRQQRFILYVTIFWCIFILLLFSSFVYDVSSVRDTTWGKSGSPGALSLLVITETRLPESVFWPSCTHCHCSQNANHIIFGENKSLKAYSCLDTPWRSSLPTFAMSKVQIKFNYFSLENICPPIVTCIFSCRLWRNQITKDQEDI